MTSCTPCLFDFLYFSGRLFCTGQHNCNNFDFVNKITVCYTLCSIHCLFNYCIYHRIFMLYFNRVSRDLKHHSSEMLNNKHPIHNFIILQYLGKFHSFGNFQHLGKFHDFGNFQHLGKFHHFGKFKHLGKFHNFGNFQHLGKFHYFGNFQHLGKFHHFGNFQHLGKFRNFVRR